MNEFCRQEKSVMAVINSRRMIGFGKDLDRIATGFGPDLGRILADWASIGKPAMRIYLSIGGDWRYASGDWMRERIRHIWERA